MKNKLNHLITIALFLIIPFGSNANADENSGEVFSKIFQSVVLIRNESFLSESAIKPWMKETISTGYGTGLVIGKNQILTNAHVVMDSKFLIVQHYNKKKKYRATIKHLAIDCDLAIIEVEDDDFNDSVNVFPISDKFPNMGSELLILGYPNGTENLTVEKGNVLSIEKGRYSLSGLDYRNVIKVKSSIVPGNSGGPAIKDGKVVGLVFQISQSDRNIAYLIPTDIINHFLTDIKDGKYDGFPNLGFTYQSGEHNSLKEYLGVPDKEKGIILNSIYPQSSFFDYLKERDFIYKVDDFYINNESELIADQNISLIDYIENKFIGDEVTFYFFRQGKKYKATSKLKLTQSLNLYRDENVNYFIDSGLVFQPVSKVFFSNIEPTMIDSSAKYHFSYFIQDKLYRFSDRDLILSYVFDDPEHFRIQNYKFKVVETINGYSPKDITNFINLWNQFRNQPIQIKFRGVDLPLTITPENRKKINTRVRKRYGVKNDAQDE
ncbi:MAG: trypsin-like peptidase domain-containing protein [Leptospira sp.]|nr:trypsin-like peptidase domain-containing protein [Leptospira sp.]